jgi:hypothetical protein
MRFNTKKNSPYFFYLRNLALIALHIFILSGCAKDNKNNENPENQFVGTWSLYAIKDSVSNQWNYKPLYYQPALSFVECRNGQLTKCTPSTGNPTCKTMGVDTFIITKETLELANNDSLFLTIYRNDKNIDYAASTCNKLAHQNRVFSYIWAGANHWNYNPEKKILILTFPGQTHGGYQTLPNQTFEYNVIEKDENKMIFYLPQYKRYYHYTK